VVPSQDDFEAEPLSGEDYNEDTTTPIQTGLTNSDLGKILSEQDDNISYEDDFDLSVDAEGSTAAFDRQSRMAALPPVPSPSPQGSHSREDGDHDSGIGAPQEEPPSSLSRRKSRWHTT